MVERIKQILEYYTLSPASFAEQIGINRSNLTHLFSGRNQPSLELAKKILLAFPAIKTEWLIMGVGQMFRDDEEKEMVTKIQNEKKIQAEKAKPDLFNAYSSPIPNVTVPESVKTIPDKEQNQIFDSREVEKPEILTQVIEKQNLNTEIEPQITQPNLTSELKQIVFFYSDKSFEVFNTKK
jgi:transcriptional regulator with XRE-family HTH domain